MAVAKQSPARPREENYVGFATRDWLMLAGVVFTWGPSFLLIDIGVEHLAPALVAFGRIALGAATLGLFEVARQPVKRSDWPPIALLGLIWLALPFLLFSTAQQWIDSSLAGMINAAAPLFTALVAAFIVRQLPSRLQAIGLVVGFLGVMAVSLPSVEGTSNAAGVGLVLLATVLYGFSFNLLADLQRRNGALAVIWRSQILAAILVLPVAIISLGDSEFAWSSMLAVAALGVLGTALAFFWFTALIGRVGSTRAAVALYFIPIVAITLGAALNDESLHIAALLGTALVLAGAYMTSRPKTDHGLGVER
jgi:drug/metabolite transporter (DMT)-like permease